jgi:hypothetical protein
MAIQVQHHDCVIPAGTPIAAPAVIPMQLGVFVIDWIELKARPGSLGTVGFYLASSGQQVIPFNVGAVPNWFVWDDTEVHWEMSGLPTSGDWSLVGYNLGRFAHTIDVRFGLDLVPGTPSQTNLLTAESLSTL